MKKICILTAIILTAALTFQTQAAPRDTPEMDGNFIRALAGEDISQGQNVAIRTTGLAWLAVDTATNGINAVVGRAETNATSNEYVVVKQGTFLWKNEGSITTTSVGAKAYAMSAIGVSTAAAATNDVEVGRIIKVETAGVWVKTEL